VSRQKNSASVLLGFIAVKHLFVDVVCGVCGGPAKVGTVPDVVG
jgi:hypothetical protein